MILQKNTAGQKLLVYAYNAFSGEPVTGDAGNITAYISKDGADGVATDDTNPTAVVNMNGWYAFDLAQAETNCNNGVVNASSTTADVLIRPVEFSCLTQLDTINTNIASILAVAGMYEVRSDYVRDGSGNITSYRYRAYTDSAHTDLVADLKVTLGYTDGLLTSRSVADWT